MGVERLSTRLDFRIVCSGFFACILVKYRRRVRNEIDKGRTGHKAHMKSCVSLSVTQSSAVLCSDEFSGCVGALFLNRCMLRM